MDHPLDRTVWNALTTGQKHLAQGDARAWRFPADIGPFAASADLTPHSIAALEKLVPQGGAVAVFEAVPVDPPPGLELMRRDQLHQMMRVADPGDKADPGLVSLGDADAAEMLALATMTRPGPFSARTHILGGFLGIREGGKLVAMAGRRMQPDGFAEVSALCTHPDFRGRGYGEKLLRAVAADIHAEGKVPFLHVFTDNHGAIALYEKLGFAIRRTMSVNVMCREGAPPPELAALFKKGEKT